MASGYIGIYRSLFKHWIWCEDRPRTKAEAFIDLLQLAAWEPTKRLSNEKLIALDTGELVASERYLSNRWKWSRTKTRSYLELLEKDHMISRKPDQGETIIKLSNYAGYNAKNESEKPEKEPPIIPPIIPPENQGSTKVKKYKKLEEVKECPPTPQGGVRRLRIHIPESLNNPTFLRAFDRWQEYLEDQFKRKPAIHTLEAHLRSMAPMGLSRALQAMDNAIAKSLREPAEPFEARPSGKGSEKKENQPLIEPDWAVRKQKEARLAEIAQIKNKPEWGLAPHADKYEDDPVRIEARKEWSAWRNSIIAEEKRLKAEIRALAPV